jgi:myosin protein heavy chain
LLTTDLKQYFNHHMFILEQEEYGRENIEWSFVNFGLDLQPTIELIESTQPIGILSTLDEECIMPKATDITFLEKLKAEWDSSSKPTHASRHPGSANFQSTRFGNGFVVKHYAGPVEYSTEGWLAKNKDPINDDVAGLLSRSSQPSVAAMFSEYGEQANSTGFVNGKRVKRGAFRTAAQKHREQLASLVNQLGSTQPHFVRCIVPNSNKKPSQVDVPLVLDQLRCNGVLEGIRIARLGYPNRLPFVEFRQRYEVLCPNVIPKGYMDGRKACLKMTEALELASDVHKMGLTKIFFKAGVLADLEERRDAHLYDIFARFQSTARRSIARRKLNKLLNRAMAVRTIQRNARTYIELRDWPWWQLFNQVKPLLAATREDDQLSKKRTELALAKERAERDEAEKAKLAELQMRLQVEKQTIEASLAAERQSALEKDGLLERSKQTESELQEEVQALQGDIDTLEEHLEAAETARLAAEARSTDIRAEFEAKTKQNEEYQQRDLANQHKLAEASEKLLAFKQNLAQAEREKGELKTKLEESSKQAERAKDDFLRIKERVRFIESEAEGKVKDEKTKK